MLNLDVYWSAAFNRRFETFIGSDSQGSAYLAPVAFFGARLWVGRPAGVRIRLRSARRLNLRVSTSDILAPVANPRIPHALWAWAP